MAESMKTGGGPERGGRKTLSEKGAEMRAQTRHEVSPHDPWAEFIVRRGREMREQTESHREERLQRTQERRESGGSGLVEAGAGVIGLGLLGGLWTMEQALKYALLGWKIDSNGWPQFDKESLARFDRWYAKTAGKKAA